MAAGSGGLPTLIGLKLVSSLHLSPLPWSGLESKKRRRTECGCSVVPIRRTTAKKSVENAEERRFDSKKSTRRARVQATTALPFASPQYVPIFRITYIYVFVALRREPWHLTGRKLSLFMHFTSKMMKETRQLQKAKLLVFTKIKF